MSQAGEEPTAAPASATALAHDACRYGIIFRCNYIYFVLQSVYKLVPRNTSLALLTLALNFKWLKKQTQSI